MGSDVATRSDYPIGGEEKGFSAGKVVGSVDVEEPAGGSDSDWMKDLTGLGQEFDWQRGERAADCDGGGSECAEGFAVA